MDPEILAYLGAALMVVLAFAAYRYWHSTANYALRMREARARQVMGPLKGSTPPVADDPASEMNAEEDIVGPPLGDVLPEAAEVAPTGDSEETGDPATPSEHTDLPEEPIAEIREIEPAPGEETPHEESADERSLDHGTPGEDPVVETPTTSDSPTVAPSTHEPRHARGDESEQLIADDGTDRELTPPPTHPGSGRPPQDVDDAASSKDAEPRPDETEEEVREAKAEDADDQAVEDSGDTGTESTGVNDDKTPSHLKPEHRLIEELEPRKRSLDIAPAGSVAKLLKELDERLAALPSGIELIDLPILERRRIADRREELLSDRGLLLEQKKRGAHRRRRRSRTKS